MNAFTIYSLFATPFMYVLSIHCFRLVFPEYYPEVRSIELINDIFFMIDIVLSFSKLMVIIGSFQKQLGTIYRNFIYFILI
jgi:hypothetical protein